MQQTILTIMSNEKLTGSIFRMKLKGDVRAVSAPGQFINIHIGGLFLRRPISVCDLDGDELTIIYRTVGKGTGMMSEMMPGTKLDVLTGLGNGYETGSIAGERPLLAGGGVGVPPLYLLAKKLLSEGKKVQAVLGFNTADEIFYADEFRSLGADVIIATADGSAGIKGFVTDAFPKEYSYVYACGPMPMLKAVHRIMNTGGQFSFESRMGCGFGACMGCSMKTTDGYKRICKDGPVLRSDEIIWED